MQNSLFKDFLGEEVKAPFRDGKHIKVARGTLEAVQDGFIRLRGNRGLILINQNNIEKITKVQP